ncbi:MAG: hypothetical protein LBS75_00890 [Synergistaceae bacterium]|nr:hypothetical protein [Synergistaceae bacterium]
MAILMLRAMNLADDLNTAHNRAEMVFAILRQPIEQCGYGMPKNPSDFADSFNFPAIAPFNWKGAISTAPVYINEMRENGSCRIAYAVSSNILVKAESETSGEKIEVIATGAPPLLKQADSLKGATSVKNWAVFGAMLPDCRPLRLSRAPKKVLGGTSLSFDWNRPVSSDANILIPENDELFYLRAMECRVLKKQEEDSDGNNRMGYSFYTFDHMGTGWQPRVNGVIDIRFELDPGGRMIKVRTLTKGDTRHSKKVSPKIPDGWPEEYASAIPDDILHYVLVARSASFELKNF